MGDFWVWCGDGRETQANEYGALLAKAKELVDGNGCVCGIVASLQLAAVLPWLRGADRILWLQTEGSSIYLGHLLASIVRERQPQVLLFSAGLAASQVAAHAAARLETGLSADCTALWMENDLLVMHRPAFGGGVEADILCPLARPQMATVRAGVLPPSHVREGIPEMEVIVPPQGEDPVRILTKYVEEKSGALSSAEIVIAGGLGVGSRENFKLLEVLAERLGGSLGATRAAVDAGYAGWQQQIGQTGKHVQPNVYLAFGISGSIQHVMGMHQSGFVVAVNSDPKAPIFDYADIAIVADWKKVVTRLLERLK